jgi:hypothetical protein
LTYYPEVSKRALSLTFANNMPKSRALSAGVGRQVIPHCHKVELIIRILSKLHKVSQQALKNYD